MPVIQHQSEWLRDVEHVTKDTEGYVYWKGSHVEHYSHMDTETERKSALELSERCKKLEVLGVPVNSSSAIWWWSWFDGFTPETFVALPEFVRDLFTNHRGMWESEDGRVCWFMDAKPIEGDEYRTRATFRIFEGEDFEIDSDNIGAYYHPMKTAGWGNPKMGQEAHQGSCYATTEQVLAWMRSKGIL